MADVIHPQKLPINQLEPNPLQPRGLVHKGDLDEMVTSILTYGILEPLVVAHTPAGYQIIAGERRWRAAQAAGLKEVPVVVRETTPKGMLEMAIIENVQRVELTPIERAQAFSQLVRDFSFSYEQIATRIGKSNPYVINTIHLLRLPDAVKDGLISGAITEGHARALQMIQDPRATVECFKLVLKGNYSVRRTEDLARRTKIAMGKIPATRNTGVHVIVSDEIDVWQKSLLNSFRPKSEVLLARSARQTKITIMLKGNPKETQADLNKVLQIAKINSSK